MKYIISIVSHGHYEILCKNTELVEISKIPNVTVIIKDNMKQNLLKSFCNDFGFVYLTSPEIMGFGENNNFVYKYAVENLSLYDDDYFLAINPDVVITKSYFVNLIKITKENPSELFSIDLYKDRMYTISEDSLRKFPSISSFFNIFLKKPVCKAYDKNTLHNFSEVDWASGAFLGFKSALYKKLNGFDLMYFMYYEDVDICFRAKVNFLVNVVFIKAVKAEHVGAYQNRNVFSQHFLWYMSSLCKFLIRKSFFGK